MLREVKEAGGTMTFAICDFQFAICDWGVPSDPEDFTAKHAKDAKRTLMFLIQELCPEPSLRTNGMAVGTGGSIVMV